MVGDGELREDVVDLGEYGGEGAGSMLGPVMVDDDAPALDL